MGRKFKMFDPVFLGYDKKIKKLFRAHPEWRGNWHALVRALIDTELQRCAKRARKRRRK